MQVSAQPLPNHQRIEYQTWGVDATNLNALYGSNEFPKPRWEITGEKLHDIGALSKFGIDPTRPAGHGIIMQANHYGYALDGYTTGYTVKLPPPADFATAIRTPLSFNTPSVVEASDGTDLVPAIPGDDPVSYINNWTYGAPEQQATFDEVRALQEENRLAYMARTKGKGAGPTHDTGRIRPIGHTVDQIKPLKY